MKKSFSSAFILLTVSVLGVVLNAAVNEEDNEGNAAVIQCSYNATYTNDHKYFCKGPKTECKTLIKTDGQDSWVNKGRLSLNDDTERNMFVVTIKNLSLEDEGEYGCGVNVSGPDLFIVVKLTVIKAQKQPSSTLLNSGSILTRTVSGGSVIVCVSVGVGLFVLAALLSALFWLRWKRQKKKADEGDHQNAGPSAKYDMYAALDPTGRTSDDVYHTLTVRVC